MPADGGAALYDVRLQAVIDTNDKGIVCLPKLNSNVIIGQIGNDDNQWFVCLMTEIDKVLVKSPKFSLEANFTEGQAGVSINLDNKVKINFDTNNIKIDASGTISFNGGGHGGLVVAESVSSQLNTVINRVNALQNALNLFVTAYNAHVPTPATPAVPLSLPALFTTGSGNFQNNKVTH